MAPKPKAAEPKIEAAPTPKTEVAEPSLPVAEGLTADHALAPNAEPQDGETLEQAIARVRAVRSPFGVTTQKLALPVRPGYHRHWFNDVAGRIDEATTSGWAHVKDQKTGQPMKRTVGSGRDGGALIAYAMELPEVFWQEEMDARHKRAAEQIDAIKKRPFAAKPGQAQASDKGKFYDPTEGGTNAGPLTVVKG